MIQTKILVQEQAVRAQEQRLADNETEGDPSSNYRGLEMNDTEGACNDEEEDEDEDMDDDEEELENDEDESHS